MTERRSGRATCRAMSPSDWIGFTVVFLFVGGLIQSVIQTATGAHDNLLINALTIPVVVIMAAAIRSFNDRRNCAAYDARERGTATKRQLALLNKLGF